MNYRLVEDRAHPYVEVLPGDGLLESEREALDLVAACGEYDTCRLLLPDEILTDDFFNLRTGVAGEILLKFVNYGVRAAAVVPRERVGEGRFAEFVLETNRGKDFRVYNDRENAVSWLTSF